MGRPDKPGEDGFFFATKSQQPPDSPMDAATIQARLYAGYGQAAVRLGGSFDIYRPTGPLYPLSLANKVGETLAVFTVAESGYNFERGASYKDVLFDGLLDGSQTKVGDYLVSEGQGTYFVAAQQPLLPILCVLCNHTLAISAPGPAASFGAQSAYGGTDLADETLVAGGWPASVIFDARGRAAEVGLPTDLPSPYFVILVPAAWQDIRSSQFVTDEHGRRYTIGASERTALGWRVFAQQAVT
jgi:hypothetical protein